MKNIKLYIIIDAIHIFQYPKVIRTWLDVIIIERYYIDKELSII